MSVIRDWELIHPRARMKFTELRSQLEAGYKAGRTRTRFEVFETYRSPLRQQEVKEAGNSRAGIYQSAHNFGLAVDFVPFTDGQWSWDPDHDWLFLRAAARSLGLKADIPWDLAHVEHPVFEEVKKALRF